MFLEKYNYKEEGAGEPTPLPVPKPMPGREHKQEPIPEILPQRQAEPPKPIQGEDPPND